MKTKKPKLPKSVDALINVLREELDARVDAFDVSGPKPRQYQLVVESPKFARMKPMRRQDLLWEIIYRVLDRDERHRVLLVLALSPSEAAAPVEA